MPNTRKLYYEDVFCMQFCARVLSCTPEDDHFIVTLDATAFYPRAAASRPTGALWAARAYWTRTSVTA